MANAVSLAASKVHAYMIQTEVFAVLFSIPNGQRQLLSSMSANCVVINLLPSLNVNLVNDVNFDRSGSETRLSFL